VLARADASGCSLLWAFGYLLLALLVGRPFGSVLSTFARNWSAVVLPFAFLLRKYSNQFPGCVSRKKPARMGHRAQDSVRHSPEAACTGVFDWTEYAC